MIDKSIYEPSDEFTAAKDELKKLAVSGWVVEVVSVGTPTQKEVFSSLHKNQQAYYRP